MRTDSLTFRLIAGAAIFCVAALAVGGIALSAIFRDAVQRNFDARLVVLLESLVAASEIDQQGRLELSRTPGEPRFEQPYSGWYWQIDRHGGEPLRSRSLWDAALAEIPADQAGTPIWQSLEAMEGQRLRRVSQTFQLPGSKTPFVFTVAGDLGVVEVEIGAFNNTLAWSFALLGISLISAMLIQVRFGLRPLRQIRSSLAAIRAGHARRLEGRFPAEIEPMASELNALLTENEAVVDRARTHVGNLAHALKTPLAVLTNEADDQSGAFGALVGRQTALMRRNVDHYLARARTAATGGVLGARTPVTPVLEDLKRTLLKIHADKSLTITLSSDPGAAFRGERQDLEEMLGNVMDNGCKWAKGVVAVAAVPSADRLEIIVEDDGPGLSSATRARVLERGQRLDESTPGTGLGLAIVRDICQLYGGSIRLSHAAIGGLRVELEVPASTTDQANETAGINN